MLKMNSKLMQKKKKQIDKLHKSNDTFTTMPLK